MKEDGNATTGPALMRVQAHAHDVTEDHYGQVQCSKYEQTGAEASSGIEKVAATSMKVEADFSIEQDDEDLAGKQSRVGHKAGHPLVHGREPQYVECRHQKLTENTKAKQE